MSTIKQLSQESSRLLSSSNIITSVFSVVKELIENALDAGATSIEVKLENYGLEKIEVRDNGAGIRRCDVASVAKSHFTSKISSFSDLEVLKSYGFRGEALSAICAISGLSITTKTTEDDISMTYTFDKAGNVISSKPSASPSGTTISVLNLFNNIPVRKKFYKSEKHRKDEVKKIEDLLCAYACAQIGTRFALFHNRNLIWQKTATSDLKSTLIQVFGSSNVINLEYKSEDCEGKIKIEAFLPQKTAPVFYVSRTASDRTIIVINKRPVKIKAIEKLLQDTYSNVNDDSKNRYPICFLSITVPSSQLDINVDPNKSQVLLHNFEEVLKLLSTFLQTVPTDQNCQMQNVPIANSREKCSEICQEKSNDDFQKSSCELSSIEKCIFAISEAELANSILDDARIDNVVPSIQIKETTARNLQQLHENVNSHRSEAVSTVNSNIQHTTLFPQERCERSGLFDVPQKIAVPCNVEKNECSVATLQSKLFKSDFCIQKQISKDGNLKDNSDFFSVNRKNLIVGSEKDDLITKCFSSKKQSIPDLCRETVATALNAHPVTSKNLIMDSEKENGLITECLFSSKKPSVPDPCRETVVTLLSVHPEPKLPHKTDENIPPVSDLIVPLANGNRDPPSQRKPNSDSEWAQGKKSDSAGNVLKPVSVLIPNQSPKKKRSAVTEVVSRDQKKQKVMAENNKDKECTSGPTSAFDCFCRNKRLEVAAQNLGCDNKQIAQILFEQWKALSPEEQNKYAQSVQKQEFSKQKSPKNRTVNSCGKSRVNHANKRKRVKKLKEKEIPFEIEELRKKFSRNMCVTVDSGSKNLVPIKALSSGVWVCKRNNNLLLLNTFRMRESLLLHRLLETYQLKADVLQEPIVITPESLGDSDSYNMLLFLCMKENSSDVSNACILSNGFNIKFSKGNCIAQLVGLSSLIPSYGLQDLREILCLLKADENLLLSKCRPFKVIHYLQGEAVRIARQSLSVQRKGEFLDLYSQIQKYLGDMSACFHNRAFEHQLFDLNELLKKQKAASEDENISFEMEL